MAGAKNPKGLTHHLGVFLLCLVLDVPPSAPRSQCLCLQQSMSGTMQVSTLTGLANHPGTQHPRNTPHRTFSQHVGILCLPAVPRHSQSGRRRLRAAAGESDVVNNLGQLNRFALDTSAEDMSWAVQRVSPESFANRGLYVDTPIVLASGFLLLLLVALSMQRILGLDRIVARFMIEQQEHRKQQKEVARQQLERSWKQDFEGKGKAEE